MTCKKWLPDNVTPYRDRHGKTRYRFRKTGLPTHHFRNEPGTAEFMEEYLLAKAAEKPEPEPRFEAGTVDAVVAALYKTPRWKAMRPSSKATYQGIIERFRKTNGHRKITSITTQRLDAGLADGHGLEGSDEALTADCIATAIRAGKHYGKDQQ